MLHFAQIFSLKREVVLTMCLIGIMEYVLFWHKSTLLQLVSNSSNLTPRNPIIYRAGYRPGSNDLTMEDMMTYFFDANASSCRFVLDFGFSLGPSDTMGMSPDGFKAVCMDPGVRPKFNDCLVYSFGIRDEWSFDEEMQSYDCNVYAFDPSMNSDDHQHSERVWFFNLGLGPKNVEKDPSTSWKMRTLDSIYEMLQEKHGRRVIDYLKIDIDFSEWETLPQIYASGLLDNVKQIGMDVHLRELATLDTFREHYRIIRALEKEHGFVRFSSRPSAWARVYMDAWGRLGNYAFEMAWYNSKFVNQTFLTDPYTFW